MAPVSMPAAPSGMNTLGTTLLTWLPCLRTNGQ